MREALPPRPLVFRDFSVHLCIFSLLLVVLLLELALAWPYGHVTQVRAVTQVLPIELWQMLTSFGDARWQLAIALLLVLPDRRILLVYLMALLFGWLTVRGLKHWFHVPRPGLLMPVLDASLNGHEASSRNSFPSSHAMVLFSFVGVLAAYFPLRNTLPAISMAFLVSISRIGIGAHWPVDVLGGGLVGILAASLAVLLWQRMRLSLPVGAILGLVLVIAVVVASMPWVDAGNPSTQPLRLLGALVGIVAAGRVARAVSAARLQP